ncbi:MAG: hydrogenase expression/formation protein HypE [Methanonatronarchaeia archaeon]|nr:MAG: hydrogenase expression/formation protein HypE [Methanonatronarchaeia archaeon]
MAKKKKYDKITIEHGAGGEVMEKLIKEVVLNRVEKKVDGIGLHELDDGASIPIERQNLVITTDSHVVRPLFFPGGDIGRLSVSGTVNDLAVMGAEPLALTTAMVIEEGLDCGVLERTMESISNTAREADVDIVSGDTKVMERGEIDGLIINTTGIGLTKKPVPDSGLKPGDKIIITGSIGNHGLSILSHREGFNFESELKSDVRPVNHITGKAVEVGGVNAMKDPTRGGLAKSITDMAVKSGVDVELDEEKIPIKREVKSASEILGIDPMTVANEGIAVIGVEQDRARDVVEEIRKCDGAEDAAVIGNVRKGEGEVIMKTEIGGKRYVEAPAGDPIPRVC